MNPLLSEYTFVQLGCGIAGDVCCHHIQRLGAKVYKLVAERCPYCGELCDDGLGWRSRYNVGKDVKTASITADALEAFWEANGPISALVVDGVVPQTRDWLEIFCATHATVLAVLSTSCSDHSVWVEANGLAAEALSGVVGTMGPEAGAPTPLGFLYGESNLAVRAAAGILDRLVAIRRASDTVNSAHFLLDLDAADACIDAMDNPWPEATLPGPIHESPNSLRNHAYQRTGNQRAGLVPYGLFETRRGWMALVGLGTAGYLAEAMERPDLMDDPRFATAPGRVANRRFAVEAIAQWTSTLPSADEGVHLLGNGMVAATVRRLDEILPDPDDILGFEAATSPYRIRT